MTESTCSFPCWYSKFEHVTVIATIIPLPQNIIEYLENDAFILPVEATDIESHNSFWCDGLPVENQGDESTVAFPEFSQEIQKVIDKYQAVFVKCNWRSPLDAIWVAPTKTLKCQTLEEVYLLLKSSDRILKDLKCTRDNQLQPCLVLKQWKDINPCTEFRCFIMENKLVGIGQRDTSRYHPYNESEQYDLKEDIEKFFKNYIENQCEWCDYTFDIFRSETNQFQIIDFGPLNEMSVKNTLFDYHELKGLHHKSVQFRFIGEEVGIQPKTTTNFCVPQEINEFYQISNNLSTIDMIQTEVEKQSLKEEIN